MENIDLYPFIFSRKSTRNFLDTPLETETLNKIESFILGIKPLLPESKITHKIVSFDEVKGMGLPKAPHYILISGAEQPLRNTCAGFLYQHAELYLYSLGLAARWIGSAKSKQPNPNSILGIAFGKPAKPEKRTSADFNRKPVTEIAKGNDTRLEAARLAPSGINKQPWYFIVDGNAIHAYYQKSLGGLIGMFYKMTDLDAGIALCHLAVASKHEGKPFNFNVNKTNPPTASKETTAPKGFVYLGTVE